MTNAFYLLTCKDLMLGRLREYENLADYVIFDKAQCEVSIWTEEHG